MLPVILVTGKNGQLGKELQQLAGSFPQFNFIFTDRTQLDISDFAQVNYFFLNNKVAFCINAAAYTAVDKAETQQEEASLINAAAVENLALVCTKHHAQLIHISTDYVYDGTAISPYTEDHPTSPVNYYGFTKLEGELLALKHSPSSVIIRTSWVYSQFGNNFVKTMLRLTSEKESIGVVNDQVGSPTYAADLAAAIMHIITVVQAAGKKYGGIYHFSNDGIISWYEFAIEIRDLAGNTCVINPIPSSDFPTPAKRPGYSAMNKDKIVSTFNIQLRDWKDSLKECIQLLKPTL